MDGCRDTEASARGAGQIRKPELRPKTDERQPSNRHFLEGNEPASEHFYERAPFIASEIEGPLGVDVESATAAGGEEQRVSLGSMNPRKDDRVIEDSCGKVVESLGGFFERHLLAQSLGVAFGRGHRLVSPTSFEQLDGRLPFELRLRSHQPRGNRVRGLDSIGKRPDHLGDPGNGLATPRELEQGEDITAWSGKRQDGPPVDALVDCLPRTTEELPNLACVSHWPEFAPPEEFRSGQQRRTSAELRFVIKLGLVKPKLMQRLIKGFGCACHVISMRQGRQGVKVVKSQTSRYSLILLYSQPL